MRGLPQGKIDYHSYQYVRGRISGTDTLSEPAYIQITSGRQIIEDAHPCLATHNEPEGEVGTRHSEFLYRIPGEYLDGNLHQFHFRLRSTGEELENSPVSICHLAESQHIPYQTVNLVNNRVLVLSPHPDDECLGCGGAIILHSENGDDVKIVFLTDGSKANIKGECSDEEYIRVRKAEANRASMCLGVSDIEFWDIRDRALSLNEETIARLSSLLEAYNPSLIYVPSPTEAHPDHKGSAAILWKALQRTRIASMVAFYEYNCPTNANALVDITPVVELKRRACRAYKSQNANYAYVDFAISLNRYRALTVSHSCDYAEGFLIVSSKEALRWPLEVLRLKGFVGSTEHEKSEPPLVSIIIRTKDKPLLLREAIYSVITQTYPSIELIVVNDGVQDVSSIINEFKGSLQIHYEAHSKPRGRTAAANTGLAKATGKYVNFLDDDDILYPGHIQKLASFLESTGEQFAYSDCEIGFYRWDDNGFSLTGERSLYCGFDFDRDKLYFENYIPMMTAMFNRKLCEMVGPLDEGLDALEDWDYWLKISRHVLLQHVPGITAEYRFLADHIDDSRTDHLKIYRRHQDYWSLENLTKATWPRIRNLLAQNENSRSANLALQTDNLNLRTENTRLKVDLSAKEDELLRITSSYGWRLLSIYGRIKYRHLLPAYRLLGLIHYEKKET